MWSNFIVFSFSFACLQEVPDENYDLPYSQTETNGDAVMIKMEMPNREESSFPKEKWKTFWGKYTATRLNCRCHPEQFLGCGGV